LTGKIPFRKLANIEINISMHNLGPGGTEAMKIKPLNDWAVIVPSEAMTRTAGGLFIPEAAKEKPAEGIVEAIGPGALEEEKRGE